MSTKTVFFGYIAFLREEVDIAKQILAERPKDYLWSCFDPTRITQDGPATPYPNMSFSTILDTEDIDDIDDTIADFQTGIAALPFLSAVLVVEREGPGAPSVFRMSAGTTRFFAELVS